jgi:hypothetical protein
MTSFNKIIELDEFFHGGKTFEPTVQLISSGLGKAKSLNSKVASEASEWSRSINPEEGSTFILVLAMGASEFYGPNRNGDAFREVELKKKYKTFETNAHVFRSHVNKDPAKSMGSVVKAFYNEPMHRVELVLKLNNSKCPDIVDKIREGETVAVSMGCRIEFDVCTICGNKAPSRKEYCEHLLNELNDIYPDGRIVAADNPDPNFFDISVVYKPADKTGYMLKKIAAHNQGNRELGLPSSIIAEKIAARTAIAKYLTKAADIDKIVTGVGIGVGSSKPSLDILPKDTSSSEDSLYKKWLVSIVPKLTASHMPIADSDLSDISSVEFPKVINTLSKMGIFLTTPEFLDLMFMKLTGNKAPEGLASKLISLQGDIFSLLAKYPEIAKDFIATGGAATGTEGTDKYVETKLSSYVPFRSMRSGNIINHPFITKANYLNRSNSPRPTSIYSTPTDLIKSAAVMLACYKADIIECTSNEKTSSLDLAKEYPTYRDKVAYHAPWVPYTVDALDKSLTKLPSRSSVKVASYGFRNRFDVERHLVNLIVQ